MSLRNLSLTMAVLALVCSCDRGNSENPEPTGDQPSGAKAPTPAGKPAPSTGVEDPGPQFERKTGRIATVEAPGVSAKASGRGADAVSAYVEVELPNDLDSVKIGRGFLAPRLIVAGDRYGLAVPANEGIQRDRPLFLVRFVGAAAPPDPFTVTWNEPADREGHPGIRQVFTVTGAAAAEARAELPGQFYDFAAQWFRRRGRLGGARSEPFYAFATTRLQTKGAIEAQRREVGTTRPVRAELADAMAFYTGVTSIEEALQADRGLRATLDDKLDEVPLKDVPTVDLPGHPWAELIAKVPNQPTAVVEPLAEVVPADVLYLHFHDLRTLVRLAKDVSELLSPLARVLEERPGARHFVERYERQLAIERMGLAEQLGHLAAKGVALVASDPFFREGTEVAILFQLNNEALLNTALSTYEGRAKARRPDAEVSEYTVAGQTVRRFGTADDAINQHRVKRGEVLIIANSRPLLERILATTPETSLAGAGEFRYFRTIYPHDPKAEDGFIFIGDAFVHRVIGPRTKILQSRRMHALADLEAVGFADLLYGWLYGEPAANKQALLDAGLLQGSDLKHTLGGDPIEFTPGQGARSRWGTTAALAPLDTIEITAVSKREADAYRRFKDGYQSYWRAFIDPIGIRIMRSEDGKTLAIDGQMLPLIARSDYREIEELVGKTRVIPGDWRDGVRFLFAVDENASLRRDLENLTRSTTGNRDVKLSWLGDWVMAGVADHSGLWDAALVFGDVPQAAEPAEDRRERTRAVIRRLPLYVAAEVRDQLALAATLTALKTVVETVAPGMVEWGSGGNHAGVEIVKITEKFEGSDGGALFYAIVDRVIVMSLEQKTLEGLIDTVKSGKRPKGEVAEGGQQAQLRVAPLKKDGWLARTLAGLVERGNLNTQASARLAYEAVAVGRGWPKDPEAAQALGLTYLGFAPLSPSGGEFSVNADGLVEHTIYGTEIAPNWPAVPIEGSAAARFLDVLGTLEMSLGFEGEGASRGLHTWAKWVQR